MIRTLISLCLAVAATLAVAQQKSADTNANKQKKDKESTEPTPLFGGKKLGYKSSTNTKESTTLAFNGVEPDGRVSKTVVAATATSADADQVKKMADSVPKREQLLAFAKEGGLISR